MDSETWSMMRTLARYVIFLAVILVVANLIALYIVVASLPNDFREKTTIIATLVGHMAGNMTAMMGAIGAAFVAMVNQRKNVSLAEVKGDKETK